MLTCGLIRLLLSIGIESNPDSVDEIQVNKLISQLGNSRFAVREQAEKQLLQFGPAILPFLREGWTSKDAEIRSRCEKLLPLIVRKDLEKRAEEYVRDTKDEKKHDLPFRELFEKLAGKNEASRKLFQDVIKSNGLFLQEIDKDRKEGVKLYRERCRGLYEILTDPEGKPLPWDLGELISLFLVGASFPEEKSDWKDPCNAAHFFDNPSLEAAIKDKEIGRSLKKLLVSWVDSRPISDAMPYQSFLIFVQHNPFSEALPLLEKIARNPQAQGFSHRAIAVSTMGVLEGEEVRKVLHSLWNDETKISFKYFDDIDPVPLGDIALLASVRVYKLDIGHYFTRSIQVPIPFSAKRAKPVHVIWCSSKAKRDEAIQMLTKEIRKE